MPTGGGRFATTHWSMVVAAGEKDTPEAEVALATLCERYWYPLYAFLRRRGRKAHDAQDLVQGFFAALLEKDYLLDADRERGRFRTFMLAALRHFASHERDKANALKRGGGRKRLSLDFDDGEKRYSLEPVEEITPERMFERRWALTLLDRVLGRLRDEYAGSGKAELFDALKPLLGGPGTARPYRDIGEDLEMSEGAVKVAAHRVRKRYRDALRQEIEETVDGPEAVDDEIRHLMAALAG
ncbi:MAG: RNA polymerase sigma factor [Planctomycetota bacterium]